MRKELSPTNCIRVALELTDRLQLPVMKPKRPIQAATRWNMGFSNLAPNLPILWRRETRVNSMKKRTAKMSATAMKAGVAGVGEVSRLGARPESTERSDDE